MKKFFKSKWFKRVIAVVVILAIVGGVLAFCTNRKSDKETATAVQTAVVTRRSIVNTVTGSGTVSAYETYNIVPTVNGEIVFCDVEEGQWVEEDTVLYKFDTETSDNAISKAENSVENSALSLEQAQDNVDNLIIKAPARGVVSSLSLIIGDKANGTVCMITDNTYMIASIPVSASSVGKINVGDKVTVGLERYMISMEGVVDRVSSGKVSGANGAMVTNVDVILNDSGSIAEGTMASATFHTDSGDVEGAEAAELNYPDSAKATAEQSGTVKELKVKNGDWVDKGDVIAILENTQVENQLKTAKMNYSDAVSNLSDKRKAAEDYVLTAPISGKVMEKNYKKGDTVAGQNSTTLMVIADTTRMKFTINVDELDVNKISVGQEVDISADAIEGVSFKGVIETVSMLGNSSNGVTYYPVQVRIDEPGNLLPGMNVSAEIIAEKAENVIAVPSGAVSYFDGQYYVTVVGEVEGMAQMAETMGKEMGRNQAMGQMNGAMPMDREIGELPTGDRENLPFEKMNREEPSEQASMPQRGRVPSSENANAMPMGQMGEKNNRTNRNNATEMKQNMYAESIRVAVKTGVSDDDYIEIVEGDIKVGMIVNVQGSDNQSSGWGQMGARPMGQMGGGMPMGGGRPMGQMR